MACLDTQSVPLLFSAITPADLDRVRNEAEKFCLCPIEPVMVYGQPVSDDRLCVRCAARQALNMLRTVSELLRVEGH